ncbi:unnamed protein product [Blepharisma stoltei]|uniref:Coatomer subunit zeta n=1 Tax=Blepharisma stoltei TaxID=1481888 RepID=A0AAU9IMJ5_9CILI|nr:unnamed protein product [Blepharisma stoltei]
MLCEIKGILILDNEGRKIFSKYYNVAGPLSTHSGQILFEQQLFAKASKIGAKNNEVDVVMMDQYIGVFKLINDISINLVASIEENSIMLAWLLDILIEALELLYKSELDRAKIVDELELMMLAIDETLDDGLIMCTDATTIVERVIMREGVERAPLKVKKPESAFERAIQGAKQAITKSLMR